MAVTLQSGFPVVASKGPNNTLTLSTPSHSTTGACKLVLCVNSYDDLDPITNTAITDNTGGTIGTWTRLISRKFTGTIYAGFTWCEIWVADCSGAYSSKTVTLTVTTPARMMANMALYALEGFDAADPFGAQADGAATSDASSALIAGAITAETTGGYVVGAGLCANDGAALSARSGTTSDVANNDAGAFGAMMCFHQTAATTASASTTVGTTKTDIYWSYAVLEIRAGSSGVTGTGSSTLPALTATGSGSVGVTGLGSSTLGAITATGSGTAGVTGTGSSTLSAPTSSGTGTHGVTGSGSSTLAAPQSSGSGAVTVQGSGSSTLPALTGTGEGAVTVSGSGSSTLPALSSTGTGAVTVTGTGSSTLAALQGTGSGYVGEQADEPFTFGGSTRAEILSPASTTVELL